jgi:hypothetical protein
MFLRLCHAAWNSSVIPSLVQQLKKVQDLLSFFLLMLQLSPTWRGGIRWGVIMLRAKFGGPCGLQTAQVLLEWETHLKNKIGLSKGVANAQGQGGGGGKNQKVTELFHLLITL